jgi:hypothetical protein
MSWATFWATFSKTYLVTLVVVVIASASRAKNRGFTYQPEFTFTEFGFLFRYVGNLQRG